MDIAINRRVDAPMLRFPYFTAMASLLLSACGGPDPVDSNAANAPALPEVNQAGASATGAPPANLAATAANDETATIGSEKIPAALHGRWGLAPMDCTSTRGDAKGLLTIDGEKLKFYESVARPSDDATADVDSISGDFAFTGEGQTWTRFEALEIQGRNLVRTESNPTASFTYAKCE